jgi:hypothetical protein
MFLHAPSPRRISTDVDIMTPVKGEELKSVLETLGRGEPFLTFEEQDRGFRGLPNRRHFRYTYQPANARALPAPLLLDVVEDDFSTFDLVEKPVTQPWFQASRPATVKVQTLDFLLGDKLAAFAPRTTGVPYLRRRPDGSEMEGDLLQIAKQFFDVAALFDLSATPLACHSAWQEHGRKEATYREIEFQPEAVLRDTFQACLAITMGNFPPKRKHPDSEALWKGLRSLENHVVEGSLSHQSIFEMAGKVAWLAVNLHTSSTDAAKPFPPANIQDIKGLTIPGDLAFLNPIGGTSPHGLYYWNEAARLAPAEWIKALP